MGIRATPIEANQTEKLAAIGRQVVNVTHEIKKPLTAILMTSSLLLEEMKEGNPCRSDLEAIKEETLRLRTMLQRLLDFARPVQYYLEEVDVNQLGRNSLRLLRPQMDSLGIACRENYSRQALIVLADRCQLAQVFYNLLTNALEAMPQGGGLTVRTGRRKGEVVIQVTDTGMGIPAENIPRIFEPFFTTKPPGQGTGLGLHLSDHTVREFGGRIEVASHLGQGSTFTVRLPLAAGIVR